MATYRRLIHFVPVCITCILIFLSRPWAINAGRPSQSPGSFRFFPNLYRIAKPKLANLESFWSKLCINNTNTASMNLHATEHHGLLVGVLGFILPCWQAYPIWWETDGNTLRTILHVCTLAGTHPVLGHPRSSTPPQSLSPATHEKGK